MTNSKMTKRALFTSVIALMLCFAMLTGTTFAWFTDQETSGNNKIVAGNLDVEMYNALTADDAAIIGTETKLFDAIKYWEPGAVSYENITVANKGNLALKYQLSVNFTDGGLANALKVAVVDNGITTTDRATLLGSIADTDWQPITSFSTEITELKETNDTKTYGIVIYWQPSDNDNAYNANNGSNDTYTLDLGVTLVATQLDAEEDAFGPDYDEDAVYAEAYASNAAELAAAIEEGGTIALMNDIDLSELASTTFNLRSTPADVTLTIANGKEVTIDLNGFTLSATSNGTGTNYNMFDVRGVLTLKNGTVVTSHTGENMGWGYSTNVVNVTAGGVLNVENAELRNLGGSDMAIAVHLNNWGEVTLNVDNSILFSTYTAVRAFNSGNDMNYINITNSTLAGASQAFWVHNSTLEDFGTQEKVDAHAKLISSNLLIANPVANATDDSNLNKEANNTILGKIRYGFTNGSVYYENGGTAVVDKSETELSDALADGKYVIMTDDITSANTIGINNSATIDGNENILNVTDENGTWDSAINTSTGGTVKNLTVNGAFRGIFISAYNTLTTDIVVDNVIIDKVCYTISVDGEGVSDHSLIVKNSTLNGWTSYSKVFKSVEFTNCNFGKGTGSYQYAFCRPYNASVFTNCVFEEGFEFDTSMTSDIVFENCYYGDTLITAENAATLAKDDVTFFCNGLNGITIK